MRRKIVAIITNILNERVVIGKEEFDHAAQIHFSVIPEDMVLELIERILKDPDEVYRDDDKKEKRYNFFYRLEKGPKFLVVVVKVTATGAFFASMYSTGKSVRSKHKRFKKIKI